MKRLFTAILSILLITLLSACGPDIEITDGIIDVKYDNVRYEGSSIIIDVVITNGTEDDYYLNDIDFALYLPDEETEFCGAGFDILENVRAGSYKEYEIEFTSDFIFMSQSELENLGVTLDDLILFFWL